jgi:hypothetical protein
LIQTQSDGTTVEYRGFDPAGRVTQQAQTNSLMNGGTTALLSYAYNLAGSLTNMTYPSGRSVTTGYDAVGRPGALSGSLGGVAKNYVDVLNGASCSPCIAYAPHGGVVQMDISQGAGGTWAINEQHAYNNRLQPRSIIATRVASGQTIRGLTFGYAAGQQADGSDNNGNLLSQTMSGDGLSGAITQTYSYDGANRIASASEGSCAPILQFSYDTWGNGWVSGRTTSCYTPQPNTPVANVYDPNTNRSGGEQLDLGQCGAADGDRWVHVRVRCGRPDDPRDAEFDDGVSVRRGRAAGGEDQLPDRDEHVHGGDGRGENDLVRE